MYIILQLLHANVCLVEKLWGKASSKGILSPLQQPCAESLWVPSVHVHGKWAMLSLHLVNYRRSLSVQVRGMAALQTSHQRVSKKFTSGAFAVCKSNWHSLQLLCAQTRKSVHREWQRHRWTNWKSKGLSMLNYWRAATGQQFQRKNRQTKFAKFEDIGLGYYKP